MGSAVQLLVHEQPVDCQTRESMNGWLAWGIARSLKRHQLSKKLFAIQGIEGGCVVSIPTP